MTYKLVDGSIDLNFSDDGLLAWPAAWEDRLARRGFLDAAAAILTALPACAVRTPWIIGSDNENLFGDPRTESKSHMSGRAFDMSPMFSRDDILSPDRRIMGLAWNVVSLAMLSSAYGRYPHFVVEGDHLHVQPEAALDPSEMSAVMTMPSWYPWTDIIRGDEDTSVLDGSWWLFNAQKGTMRLAEDTAIKRALKALEV